MLKAVALPFCSDLIELDREEKKAGHIRGTKTYI